MAELTQVAISDDNASDGAAYSNRLVFFLNGSMVSISNPDPSMMLAEYLHESGLTGTKVACGQGGCGACTVMLSHLKPIEGTPVHRPVNACLRPICSLDGYMVTTTEGIGSVHEGLDPTQYCIAKYNGTQCGFCTPGFVMNTHAFLQQHPEPSQQEIEDIYGGNLCRCTGYRPLLHGMRTLACDYHPDEDESQKCQIDPSFKIECKPKLTEINLDQLPAFNLPARALYFKGSGREWYRPNVLEEVHRLKKKFVSAAGRRGVKLIMGNTASGVYQNEKPQYLIDMSAIIELGVLQETDSGIRAGASVPIQELMDFCGTVIKRRPEEQTSGLKELVRHGAFIAGYQVRSTGSIAGNIFMTVDHADHGGPFPSDVYTILATLGTSVTVGSLEYDGGSQTFLLTEMPAVTALPEDAVILRFEIPYTRSREYVQTYRIARRVQMAHPIVNAGFRMSIADSGNVLGEQTTIVFGGLSSLNCRARKTEAFLSGKPLNNDTLKSALAVLKKEVADLNIPIDEEGISPEYRRQLAENFFYKYFLHVAMAVNPKLISAQNKSAANHDTRALSSGRQEHTEYPELYPLSQPVIKRAAFVQATGEIRFTQDVGLPLGGLHGVIVKSIRPHARFTFTKNVPGLDALKKLLAKQYPGFKDLITAADVPVGGEKLIGLGNDDPVFCDGLVTSVGAPIGMVVAQTVATAREVAEFIESACIAYEDLPAVVTLEEAIKQNTAMPMIRTSKDEDEDIQQRIPTITRDGSDMKWLEKPKKAMPGTDVVHGTFRTTSQAHFYLETMCAMAIPGPYDQMTVHCSTQNPNGTQFAVARALGLKVNQVTVLIEQVGGGFGGKQHRANIVGAQAAVAARKLQKAVRLLYDRSTDMQMVGKRHPYSGDYHVAYTKDGIIKGMRIDLNSDAGDTYDATFAVMDSSLLNADQAYMIETLQANGTAYRTNKASNTAFRTFGVVQAWAIVENAIEHVAWQLTKDLGRKVSAEEIRYKNMYRNGTKDAWDQTHYGQELDFCNIRDIWDELYISSDFAKRQAAVDEFNKANRWRKRAIVMVPQKHGIGFTEPRGSLNSSSALVTVNMADASVLIYHGGVEMGQGVNTKIAQLAANTLGIPLEKIRVGGNNTDAIPNCPATAASTGYDLNGGAVERACRVLRNRLEDFCRDMEQYTPNKRIEDWRTDWSNKWQEIVFKAWFERVNLSVAELYKTPHYKGPTERNPRGKPFLYFAYGAAVTEVEIDALTGEFKILRADVVCDVNKSPNPAIDIGQLEGGFIQGIGFATTEELVYDHDGRLITDNIWSYKPPCSKTIPIDFRVRLHPVNEERNAREMQAEKHAVKASKSFTESSFTLGASVYIALKQAIKEVRQDLTGRNDWLDMDLPMTCQRIQTLCGVTTESLTL
jgi:xanthine dehydrogenase/oxidase